MPRSVITLTTDFGSSSPYVAQMKGVILSIQSDVRLVDLTHAIPPQQIIAGAVTLADSYHYFPPETIHVVVVDPGVGSDRAILLAEIDGHHFVAPDNGLLDLVARRHPPRRLVRLAAREYWQEPVSKTFHGRDIMAPVAAHLAKGVHPDRFGHEIQHLLPLDFPDPVAEAHTATATVINIDAFGNLMTNLDRGVLPPDLTEITLQMNGQPPQNAKFVTSYSESQTNQLVVLISSAGRVEFAIVNGNAQVSLDAILGTQIRLQWPAG